MTDEIKKVNNETPKDETALAEQALEQVAGGVTRSVDKASPVLMLSCANGTHIKESTTTS